MAEEDTVQVLERTTPYRGYMRIDLYKFRHQVFDRGWSDELSREVIVARGQGRPSSRSREGRDLTQRSARVWVQPARAAPPRWWTPPPGPPPSCEPW